MTSFDYTVLLSLQPPLNQGEIVFSNNNVYQLIAEMTNFRGLSRSDFTNYSFIFSVHPSNALDIIDINSHSIRFTLTNSDPSTIKLTAQGMENPKREESITIPIRKAEYGSSNQPFHYPETINILTNTVETVYISNDLRSHYYPKNIGGMSLKKLNKDTVTTAVLNPSNGEIKITASKKVGIDKYAISFFSYNYKPYTNFIEVNVTTPTPPVPPEPVQFIIKAVDNQDSQLEAIWKLGHPGSVWGGEAASIIAYYVYYRKSSSDQTEYFFSPALHRETTNFVISNLEPDTEYDIYMVTKNSAELFSTAIKKKATVHVSALPPGPPLFTLTPYPGIDPSLELKWEAPWGGKLIGGIDAVITSYRIEFRQGDEEFMLFANVDSHKSNIVVNQLNSGETYEVKLLACNNTGLCSAHTQTETVFSSENNILNIDIVVTGTLYSNINFNEQNHAEVSLLQGADIPANSSFKFNS